MHARSCTRSFNRLAVAAAAVPTAITTSAGSTGGQPVANLGVMDLSGTTDGWNRYVEFMGQYNGYLSYAVPASIPASSITGIQAQVNYRGPATGTQTWTFKLYNWTTSAWVTLGTNATAPDWGAWKLLAFTASGTAANYISTTGAMRLQLLANNANDAADIDYAALILNNTAAPADTTAPSTPGALVVTGTSASSVSLSWSASTDNVGVTGYEVFQGSGTTPVASPSGTSATIGGLTASTSYSFTVKARDAAGNRSAASATVTATTSSSGGLPAPVACANCWHPPLQVSWNWVISVVPHAPYRNVQMYDIDGFNATADDVTALHNAGKRAVCYISVGSYEDWRSDASQFPAAILGNELDPQWEGEWWLDVRNIQQSDSALARIMNARLDMCDSKGFDAVEFDNMDGYTNSTGFPLTAGDQARYNVFLANGARTRGMSAMMKNDVDQIGTLLPYFDMVLNEQCNQYDECGSLSQFVRAGKPVFNAEYARSTSFCAADNAANFNGVNFDDDLDDSKFQPCR